MDFNQRSSLARVASFDRSRRTIVRSFDRPPNNDSVSIVRFGFLRNAGSKFSDERR
jgi:hypothetical protein